MEDFDCRCTEAGATFKESARGEGGFREWARTGRRVLSSDVRCGKMEDRVVDSSVTVEILVKP